MRLCLTVKYKIDEPTAADSLTRINKLVSEVHSVVGIETGWSFHLSVVPMYLSTPSSTSWERQETNT